MKIEINSKTMFLETCEHVKMFSLRIEWIQCTGSDLNKIFRIKTGPKLIKENFNKEMEFKW